MLPFIVLTIILTASLGYVIASMERTQVMKNWSTRRCQLPVMVAASYFKPASDPRTPSEFATENFNFCMKELVQRVTEIAMAPVVGVFGQQADSTSGLGEILTRVRKVVHTIYDQFMSYLSTFFTRYTQTVYQFSRIVQYLRSVFRRVNAMAVGLVYMGLTLIRGIMNTVDFVMFVIMVILGIMVALIIILFFILFPFIPLIMSVIAALIIVATATTAGTLSHYRSAFCFAGGTLVPVMKKRGVKHVPIEEVRVGDNLADGGRVTSCMVMSGEGVQLYSLRGITVAGSHIVEGVNGVWTTVEHDTRAKKYDGKVAYVYCLNTTTHIIPLIDNTDSYIRFRDWEEYDSSDVGGHIGWNYHVFSRLNRNADYNTWRDNLTASASIASSADVLVVAGTQVFVNSADDTNMPESVSIKSVKIGQTIWDGFSKSYTRVIGIVHGVMLKGCCETGLIVWDDGMKVWRRTGISLDMRDGEEYERTDKYENGDTPGYMLITESGSFTVHGVQDRNPKHIRDFTEVGYDRIEETYEYTVGCINSGREIWQQGRQADMVASQ